MKTVLLLAATGASLFSMGGCTTVVETPRPAAVGVSVQYYHGRPYYYSGRTRYWGYPPGYVRPVHRSRVVVY